MASDTQQDPVATRQRLLDAAAEVFVEKGYRAATVRDICQRAGANIAGVNYYFRDKESLYREMLLSPPAKSLEKHPRGAWRREGMSPEELLEGYVKDFLQRLFDPEKPAWHAILMAREMVDPTGAMDEMFEAFMRPQLQALERIIGAVVGRELDARTMGHCIESVVPQIVFHILCQPVIRRLHPARRYDQADIQEIARHIARFSVAGIRAAAAVGAAGDVGGDVAAGGQ